MLATRRTTTTKVVAGRRPCRCRRHATGGTRGERRTTLARAKKLNALGTAADVGGEARTSSPLKRAEDVRGDGTLESHIDYVFDPTPTEMTSTVCQGAVIPEGFPCGTYLRNGPNSRFGKYLEHYFDGDGMIHGVHFSKSGRVLYFNHWIRTKGYRREAEAGRKLYEGVLVNNGIQMLSGVLQNIVFQDASDTNGTKDTANTAVVHHAGRTLALMEAQNPVELKLRQWGGEGEGSTVTLETKDPSFSFGGDLVGNMTAHPKIDPRSGDLISFSYSMTSKPHMRYTEVGASGRVKHSVGIDSLERGTMAHDMAITATRAVLFDLPIVFDLANIFLKNQFPIQFQRSGAARLGVIERGGTTVQWFQVAPGGNVFHTMNAHDDEETGEVVVHALRSQPERDGYIFNDYSPSYLHEYRLNPTTGGVREKRLGSLSGEFPCVNPEYTGQKCQFGYMLEDGLLGNLSKWSFPPSKCDLCYCSLSLLSSSLLRARLGNLTDESLPLSLSLSLPAVGIVYSALVKYDLESGQVVDRFDCERGLYLFEPEFVPREGSAGEEDGFLICFATHAEEDASFLVILDAKNLSKGPVSLIRVPQKVASGLHGCFVPAE